MTFVMAFFTISHLFSQNFSNPQKFYSEEFTGVVRMPMSLIDMDLDGDLDITGPTYVTEFASYLIENKGTQEEANFGSFGIDRYLIENENLVQFAGQDVNQDGLTDFLQLTINEVLYFERINESAFEEPKSYHAKLVNFEDANPQAESFDPTFIDWDNDGDLDMFNLKASVNLPDLGAQQVHLFYYENMPSNDSLFIFKEPVMDPFNFVPLDIETNEYFESLMEMNDFDNDGDLDIIMTPRRNLPASGQNLYYIENIDNAFEDARIIKDLSDFKSFHFTSGDLDNDGDVDLVFEQRSFEANPNDGIHTLELYVIQNELINTSIEDLEQHFCDSFKSTFLGDSKQLEITHDCQIDNQKIQIFNAVGKRIFYKDLHYENHHIINLSGLANGQYFGNFEGRDFQLPFKFTVF